MAKIEMVGRGGGETGGLIERAGGPGGGADALLQYQGVQFIDAKWTAWTEIMGISFALVGCG